MKRCNGLRPAAAVVLVLVIAPAAWTQEAPASPDYESCAYEDADTGRHATAGEQIRCQLALWKQDPIGRSLLENPNVVVVEGNDTVGFNVADRNWGRSRALAYARAYLNAMGEFVRLRRERRTVEITRRYFSDDSTISMILEEDPASSRERIEEKEAILSEGRLDRALREELGMSDDQIDRLTLPDRTTAFRDEVLRRSVTEAFGSAAGLIPVQTFEAVDSAGNSAIGVVVVFSERMARVADLISAGSPIPPDPGRVRYPVRERIDELSDQDLVTQFGVRLWWDEQGYPVVVSFGQWGWSSANLSNRQRDRARRAAGAQAEMEARDNLAAFINAATSFSTESIRGEIVEEGSIVHADGTGENFDETDLIDEVFENAKTRSVVNLTGLGILRTWSARHPIAPQQELIGAVAYWSPAREDMIRKRLGQDPGHAPPEPAPRPEPESGAEPDPAPSGRTQSKPLMDASDF